MLQPKKVKHRKVQKGRMRGQGVPREQAISFGEFGLQALELRAGVTARQIEAARIAMTRHVKRGGKIWIRLFPDKPITKKPAETRMGKGKGNPEEWVAVIKPGRMLYEMEGVPEDKSRARPRCGSPPTSSRSARASCAGRRSVKGERAAESSRTEELGDQGRRDYAASSSTSRSSTPPASSRTPRSCAPCAA